MRTALGVVAALVLAAFEPPVAAQSPHAPPPNYVPKRGLSLSLWAREPMVQDPVALSFDDQGRLYVAETARRGTVDIDIRGHQNWIVDDLANQSVDDLRRFFRFRMAPEKSSENSKWLPDYNGDGSHDWRDLMGVKERVRRLEDPGQTGVATHSIVYAEGFNEEIGGVLAGVMPWGDDVFATAYPSLWKLSEPRGNGPATRVESLFRGFGVHAAFDGHDLHGLTMGPDGKIYFSVGDNGFSVTTKEARQLHYPNTGAVLRMNPDGTELEVFASGLRNVQEVAFDEYGNCFGVDNDGDIADERERFVYIVEGSDSGWRLHWQFKEPGWTRFTQIPNYNPWINERMWVPHHPGQPAHITPPLSNYSVGPGSLKYNPGTALNDAYRRHFFLIQFPVQKVTAFQARPKGAGFEMVGEHVVLSGMMASAVNFGPNGALYVADWDGMWNPNGKGAIWRLDDPSSIGSAERSQVQRLLGEGMRERGTTEVIQLLGHADMRIRQRAQFELVRRHEGQTLLGIAADKSAPRLARVHALWGIAQLKDKTRAESLPFNDPDPEIRAQTARIAGDLHLSSATPDLIRLLGDARPRVRFPAALSLAKAGNETAIPSLIRLLASNDNQDAFIRHACTYALAGIGKVEPLRQLSSHPSKAVRIGAIVALRRLRSPAVTDFLQDPDPSVRAEAVRAVHDDQSIPTALPRLVALLDDPATDTQEAIARRALSAASRLGRSRDASRLLEYALSSAHPDALRSEALECLASWDRTPELDRVEGLVRRTHPKDPASARLGRQMIQDNIEKLFQAASPGFTETIARCLGIASIKVEPSLLINVLESPLQTESARSQALRMLVAHHPAVAAPFVENALQDHSSGLRMAAVEILSTSNPSRLSDWLTTQFASLTVPEQQLALATTSRMRDSVSEALLSSKGNALLAGQIPPELEMDVIQALSKRISAPSSPAAAVASKVRASQAARAQAAKDAASRMPEALYGGDARRGEQIFRTHVGAQCVRCHDAGGAGKQAGPLLTGIAKKVNREYLLEALIDPSARIAPGFETISVTLLNDDVIDGLKLEETPLSISIQPPEGEERTFKLNEIRSVSTSKLSAMPPMLDILTPFEIRDLVAFLSGLK